jgi:predicted amino acid dehydrogenase
MAYGDYDHPQVLKLRTFRDEFLCKSYLGREFIKLYYKYSPLLVEKLNDKPKTNDIIVTLLNQLIKIISK